MKPHAIANKAKIYASIAEDFNRLKLDLFLREVRKFTLLLKVIFTAK